MLFLCSIVPNTLFPRFAEGFSHLTLDVAVRLQADYPPEMPEAASPPMNVSDDSDLA